MNTIFMKSEHSKTSKPHVLTLNQFLVFITHGETKKVHTITIHLKYLHLHGMINLNYHMDLILYQIFKTISNTF